MLTWKSVKNPDGSTNQNYIIDDSGRYRISLAKINGEAKFTTWRGSVAIFCGTSQKAKEAAYEDSLKPHTRITLEVAKLALSDAREKLKRG
jgi:hypothetical protein